MLRRALGAAVRGRTEALRWNATAIGQSAYDEGPSSVRKLFGSSRRVANLTYDVALEALAAEDDSTAKAARAVLYAAASPAIARAAETPFRPHAKID